MKTILATTDFSNAAENACSFAYELAKKFGARLIVYGAYQEVPIVLPQMPVMVTPEDMRALVQESMEQQIKKYPSVPDTPVDSFCSEAPSATGILEAVNKYNADIIVAGMKGSGKGVRKLFGSTVSSLINRISIPLIVVPEGRKFNAINKIALANESDVSPEADRHLFDSLRELVIKFKSKLYLVRVEKSKIREAFAILYSPSSVKRMVGDLDPVYECIENKHVTDGLNDFIRENKVDLLAMVSHKHSVITKWLGGSETQKMIFETNIPLLIIPANSINQTSQ